MAKACETALKVVVVVCHCSRLSPCFFCKKLPWIFFFSTTTSTWIKFIIWCSIFWIFLFGVLSWPSTLWDVTATTVCVLHLLDRFTQDAMRLHRHLLLHIDIVSSLLLDRFLRGLIVCLPAIKVHLHHLLHEEWFYDL